MRARAWVALLLPVACLGQSLRDLAVQRGILMGSAVDPSHFGEPDYAGTLAREFNQVEAENAMKFGPIHPGPMTYNFMPADAIVSFAQANGMAIRGHNLVWYNQLPAWLTSGASYTSAQLSSILQDHINTVVGHYAGRIYAWDVVNEAFNGDGSLRSFLWYDSPGIGLPGTGYIEQALRWAHAADPGARLFYNDYGAEVINTKSDAIYKMAQDFKARGVPLDGIGLQMHLTLNPGSLASMDANIKRLTDLGLEVQITELDVRLPVNTSGTATPANLATEAQIYHDIVALCLKYARCTAIQTWGFSDKYSWIPGTYPGFGAALEFDTGYQAKPAYGALQNAFETTLPTVSSAALVNAASYAGGPVAPNEIVLLYGATFGPATLQVAQADASGDLPIELAQTRLLFDGVPARLLYAQIGQVAAVVPAAVGGRTTTQVQYEYQGLQSAPISVGIAPAAPGVFTLDSSGRGPSGAPTHRGDVITLFITGGTLSSPPRVSIAGIDCPVQYADAAQINAILSPDVPIGEQAVVVAFGDAVSQSGVTLLVQ